MRAIGHATAENRAEAIAASFARSPFLLDDHAAAMAALWGLPPVAAPARTTAAAEVDDDAAELVPCVAAFAQS